MLESSCKAMKKYMQEYNEEHDVETDRKTLIDDYFRNKKGEEIYSYLMEKKVNEKGGLVALSGFYYQFLVTLKYVVEMLNDSWDFVIMEYHDDIVVGKNNKIRYIQVKSSQRGKMEVTDSSTSSIYNRVERNKKSEKLLRPNSWVDKLFLNASKSKKEEGFITEFQLYSSYHLTKTTSMSIDNYTGNDKYQMNIEPKDKLLEKLSVECFDDENNAFNYSDYCGETLEELLKRLYVYTGQPLQNTEYFQSYLCKEFDKIIFDVGDTISIGTSGLHQIMGYIFEKCVQKTNVERLVITKDEMLEILKDIKQKSLGKAKETIENDESISIVNKVISKVMLEVEESKNTEVIKESIYDYKEWLEDWVKNQNGNIQNIFERLFDGTNRTERYSKLDLPDKVNSLSELLLVIVMLRLIKNNDTTFFENESLVTKKIGDSDELYSFFRLDKRKKLDTVIEKLRIIITNTSRKEQLKFYMNKNQGLNIIIQNYSDRSFKQLYSQSILLEKTPEIKGLKDELKLNEVPIILNLLPGDKFREIFYESLDEEDINSYLKETLQEIEGKNE